MSAQEFVWHSRPRLCESGDVKRAPMMYARPTARYNRERKAVQSFLDQHPEYVPCWHNRYWIERHIRPNEATLEEIEAAYQCLRARSKLITGAEA